jgi:ACS family glucarate transporter-like MFS transporter
MSESAFTPSPKREAKASKPATWVRWRIIALLMALSFVSWFNRVSLPVAYDEKIKSQFGISETAMGTVYSALLLVYMFCMTPGGWITDRFGARWSLGIMGIGLGVFGALTGTAGFVVSTAGMLYIAFLLIRSTMGLFAAPMYPAASHAVAQWMPFPARAGANGLVQGAAPLGIATTYILFGMLMDAFDWQRAFLILGATTGTIGLIWLLYSRNQPFEHPGVNEAEVSLIRSGDVQMQLHTHAGLANFVWEEPASEKTEIQAEKPTSDMDALSDTMPSAKSEPAAPSHVPDISLAPSRDGWLSLLRNRSLALLTISYAAVGYFEYLFFFWMHYYFDDVLKLGKDESRLYSAIPVLAMAVGMPIGGWLSDWLIRVVGYRWGRALVPAGGMIAAAVMLFLGVQAATTFWVVTWFSLALGAMGATEGPQWTIAIELGGRRGATAAGIFNTGGNLGGLMAPVVTPWISDLYGWKVGITLGSIVCLVGVCLWLWINPRERAGSV